ncbi:SpoIID/LytB domain-containing protein [candidate division KSB1 bacterium]|nr:SpoIID/LytB domain-containing protein [candidate division KSB1 bacterium]
MKRTIIIVVLVVVLVLSSCAPVYYTYQKREPVIRVGILESKTGIVFKPQGKFSIHQQDSPVMDFSDNGEWQVKVLDGAPVEPAYGIVLFETHDSEKAENFVREFTEAAVNVVKIGELLPLNIPVGDCLYRVMLEQTFPQQNLAVEFNDGLSYSGRVLQLEGDGGGTLLLVTPDGRQIELERIVRFAGTLFTIKDVSYGEDFHYAGKANRTYQGELEVRLNKEGGVSLINVLPLEKYLLGVLPGEMSVNFPLEALKAQTVAARTFFLHNFSKTHRNDPFDVCDDVHCQVFIGRGENNRHIQQAVEETYGMVLVHQGKLCLTPYSAVCGGHTEHAQNVWSGDGEPYLVGIFDSPRLHEADKVFSLDNEKNARDWILSHPNVYCNIERSGNPEFAMYSKKYFRWSKRVSRGEIERLASQRAGIELGDLYDIIAVKRGVSGRLSEIKFVASNGSFTVKKELNIRRVLSADILYSACFIIEKETDANGLPITFTFKGAGWGHGVGMCQIGAAMMALEEKSYEKILSFYYQNASLKKLY